LINVTEFFRDPALFSLLEQRVLPEVIAQAKQQGAALRLWSAGCATGEEPYTLALLVAEALGEHLSALDVRIFATDVDDEAVAFARRALYPAAALTHVPPMLLERYFLPEDGHYRVTKRVRSLMVFGQHDLGQSAPFRQIDLVLCRNVLIYFTPDLQRRALELFAYALREDGYLALGKAETVDPLDAYFTVADGPHKLYQRHGERPILPPVRLHVPPSVMPDTLPEQPAPASHLVVAHPRPQESPPPRSGRRS